MPGGFQYNEPSFFDVGYGIASAAITNGNTIIATTAGDYYGFVILATSAGGLVRVYDSISATTGNLLDVALIAANANTKQTFFVPVKAKKGIVVSVVTGTGLTGTVYFAPKG